MAAGVSSLFRLGNAGRVAVSFDLGRGGFRLATLRRNVLREQAVQSRWRHAGNGQPVRAGWFGCGDSSDGITACGYKIYQGDRFVAADKKYPFGTEMCIPGYKNGEVVKVLDRGGVIRGNRLDVFFNSHQEALEWGVRYLDVKIRYQ